MASLYIESADRKSLAAGAIAKLSRTKKGTHLQQEAAARACRRTATKSIFMRSAALQAARAYVEPVKMIA
jgi:hypothetical protein